MDWNYADDGQVFTLVLVMEECFPNSSDLKSFLDEHGVTFPKVVVRKGDDYSTTLFNFLTVAAEKRLLVQLLEVLKKRPLFADAFKVMESTLGDMWREQQKEKEVVSEPSGATKREGSVSLQSDLNDPELQAQYVADGITECFEDLYRFSIFLSDQELQPLASVIVNPELKYREAVDEYISHTQKEGKFGQLLKNLMTRRGFVRYCVDEGLHEEISSWAERYERTERLARMGSEKRMGEQPKPMPFDDGRVTEPNWDDLSGKQLKVIRDAIEKAFPKPKDFDIFLFDADKRPLSTHSAAGGFPQQLFDFLRDVQAEGWVRELVKELEATKRIPVRNLSSELSKVTR